MQRSTRARWRDWCVYADPSLLFAIHSCAPRSTRRRLPASDAPRTPPSPPPCEGTPRTGNFGTWRVPLLAPMRIWLMRSTPRPSAQVSEASAMSSGLREWAARLTRRPAQRARRLLDAGRAAYRGGRSEEAIALLRDARELAKDPLLRADCLNLELHAARGRGEAGVQFETVVNEVSGIERIDPVRAAELSYHAWYLTFERFDFERSRAAALHARAQLSDEDVKTNLPTLAALAWQHNCDAVVDGTASSAAHQGASLELAA